MDTRRGIAQGMTVYTRDGEKLGKVVAVDEAGLFVEKGFFFPEEYGFRFDDVVDVRDQGVHLRLAREEISSAPVDDDRGLERNRPSAVSGERDLLGDDGRSNSGLPLTDVDRTAGSSARGGESRTEALSTAGEGVRESRSEQGVTIPLAEEQLEARKTERESGELKIHKRVVTEQKTVTVPVRRETADVKRVSVSDRPVSGDEATFREETISIPLREEEIEVTKRPVIRGEVRVAKGAVEEEQQVSDTVRREEVDVEPEGEVRRSDGRDADDHHVPG